MAKKLFNKPEKRCRDCLHGTLADDGSAVFCVKKGITEPDDRCRAFVYDPLAREPVLPRMLPEHSKEEFEL